METSEEIASLRKRVEAQEERIAKLENEIITLREDYTKMDFCNDILRAQQDAQKPTFETESIASTSSTKKKYTTNQILLSRMHELDGFADNLQELALTIKSMELKDEPSLNNFADLIIERKINDGKFEGLNGKDIWKVFQDLNKQKKSDKREEKGKKIIEQLTAIRNDLNSGNGSDFKFHI